MHTACACRQDKCVRVAVVQVGQLLAVCYTDDPAQLAVTNVAGFVWVQQVDFDDDSLSLMCPHATPPPTNSFILGSIKRNLDLLTL